MSTFSDVCSGVNKSEPCSLTITSSNNVISDTTHIFSNENDPTNCSTTNASVILSCSCSSSYSLSSTSSSTCSPNEPTQNILSTNVQPMFESASVLLQTITNTEEPSVEVQSVFIEMSSAENYEFVPLYSTSVDKNVVHSQLDNLLVSSIDTNSILGVKYEPYCEHHPCQQSDLIDMQDFINSEHHFYCYSHSEPEESFIEEVPFSDEAVQSDKLVSNTVSRSERRVEFADMIRRRSRILSRKRSQSRSQSEENKQADEVSSDEEPEEDEEDEEDETGFGEYIENNRRESDLLRFIRSARSRSPSISAFRASKRSQMHRVSLLGRPIHVRSQKHVNPRYKQFQNEMHNFLERPRGWRAMTYHVIM